MLISRKSPRNSDAFQSRFRSGEGVQFPLRQYLRCREDLFSSAIHLLLLVVFTVAMVIFARTVDQIFVVHGAELNPWYRRIALLSLVFVVMSLLRRIVRKFNYLRETRAEMRGLRAQFQSRPDQDEA
jgi:hypothetical protein